jgi:hypothetical protein
MSCRFTSASESHFYRGTLLMSSFRYLCAAALLFASASLLCAQTPTGTLYFTDSNPRNIPVTSVAEANFLALFGSKATDNFDSYPGTFLGSPVVPPPSTYTLPGLPITYTSNALTVGIDFPGLYEMSVSHSQFLLSSATSLTGPFGATQFNFSQPVQGIGAYIIQAGDGSNSTSFTISLQNGAGPVRNYKIDTNAVTNGSSDGTGTAFVFQGRQFDNAFYFGIIDTTFFDKVTVTPTSTDDGYLFDNLSVGLITAIPEPSTYALIGGLGLAGVGGYFYKRRQAAKKQEQRFSLAR